MKTHIIALAAAVLGNAAAAQDKVDLTDHNQLINYAFGLDIVSTFKQQGFDLDAKAFIAGMQDSLTGNPAMSDDQKKGAIEELQHYLGEREAARRKVDAAKDLKEGEAFLGENMKKEGVQVKEFAAADGSMAQLQYKVLKAGPDGPSPKKSDIVEVHYVGSLIDGTVFDSSVKRGFPATFPLTDMIPGWADALQMMKVGDKWRLFIPTQLAYGEYGPPQIPPNSTLIFDLELLSFYTPKPNTNGPAPSATSAPVK